MVTFNLGVYQDDAQENETGNSIADYSYTTSYDVAGVDNYSLSIYNMLLRFPNVTIPSGATITDAHFVLQCLALPGGTPYNIDVYADIGATRQDAWSSTSRYETGFTPSTATDATSTSTLSVAAGQQIDCTTALQDLIDNANGGWSSGDAARFALTCDTAYREGVRFAMFNHNTGADPQLVVTYTTGGGGGGSKTLTLLGVG